MTDDTGDNDDVGGHAGVRTGRQPPGYRPRDLARRSPPDYPELLAARPVAARPGARGASAAAGPGHAAARRDPGLALEPRQPDGDLPAVAWPAHPGAAGRSAAAPLGLRAG